MHNVVESVERIIYAIKNNEINKGDIIVLTAIGSGWTWGSTVLKWGK